jgi:hypothetical protein
MRWIAVAGLLLTGVLIATTILTAYSQSGSIDDARTYQYRYRPLQMGTQIEIFLTGRCSLGFPAYYERVVGDRIYVHYGVVTASHCGNRTLGWVYQNATGANNYIGYFREEGRYYDSRRRIADPNIPVDAAFIEIEWYTYSPGSPRPRPQIVDNLLHELGITWRITDYLSSERTLWDIYNRSARVIKAGRTTRFEAGYIIPCTVDRIACQLNSEWVFFIFAYGAPGDSGGLIYWNYTVRTPHDIQIRYMGLGIAVASLRVDCITVNGETMCRPVMGNLLYNIKRALGITPYRE